MLPLPHVHIPVHIYILRRRETNRKKAAQYLREGKRAEARDALVKCIDVTPKMALELMNVCKLHIFQAHIPLFSYFRIIEHINPRM